MNLTQRLSLTHGFIALLTVAVTLTVMIAGARYLFWNEIRESQRRQLDNFALAAREAYFAHEDVAVLNFIRLSAKEDTLAFCAFADENGKNRLVLPSSFQAVDLTPGTRKLADGRPAELLAKTVEAGDKKIGTVTLAYDTDKLEARVRAQVSRWIGLGAVAGVSALLVALILSVLLSNNLVRPLKRIQTGTEQVRSGKLDKLVDVDRSDEIGSLARDFNAMVIQLKELEEMKRDFVAGVTHDFGTPLHAIKNALEFMQEGKAGPLTDKQAEYLLMISNNTLHLTTFIENLLTTARIEAAKMEPYYESLDTLALAREVVELYQPQAQKMGIELKLANQEPSLNWVTDNTQFRQILTNLVSNAMKFTLKGKVELSLQVEAGSLTLQVADTGIGIDSQHQTLIFDKFFRVHQPKGFPLRHGSGLGLSIAKGLAESMGGSIQVKSESGKGSTFIVKLPVQPGSGGSHA